MDLLRAIAAALVPGACAACGYPGPATGPICDACEARLAWSSPLGGGPPAGLDAIWSSASHEGVPRDLVVALKYRRLLPAADAMARRISRLVPESLLEGVVVPIPTARRRVLARGFDPAHEIALRVGRATGMPVSACLRRTGSGRQVGRRRSERRGNPPEIAASSPVPRTCVLIDDVLTTRSTLSSAAAALRGGGALTVFGVTFARRL